MKTPVTGPETADDNGGFPSLEGVYPTQPNIQFPLLVRSPSCYFTTTFKSYGSVIRTNEIQWATRSAEN